MTAPSFLRRRAITWSADGVTVRAEGVDVEADRALLAVPARLTGQIAFDPPLPDWKQAAISTVRPVLMLNPDYITLLIGLIGTSIAPWMQFYLQSAVVEKGITPKEYAQSRVEVVVGCIITDVVAFFIIVACAGAADVIATVKFARDSGLPLAVRGGGHSIAGNGTCDDGVVLVTLNRPPMNPLSQAMLAALGDVAEGLAHDEGVKAVVITGSEKALAAGSHDLCRTACLLVPDRDQREV